MVPECRRVVCRRVLRLYCEVISEKGNCKFVVVVVVR